MVENKANKELSKLQKIILDLLTKDFMTPKQIAIQRGTSDKAVYKIVGKLKKKGYLSASYIRGLKKPRTTSHLRKSLKLKNGIRLHGQEFNIKIINKSTNYLGQLKKRNMFFLDGNTIRLYPNSMEIYANPSLEFLGEDEQRATALSFQYWNKIWTKLENRLNIIFIKEDSTKIKQVNAHYAEINNELAKEYNNKKIKLKIFTREDGKLWFEIDNSWNLNEAETRHPSTSKQDMTQVKNFFNDIRDNHPLMPSVLSQALCANTEAIGQVISNQNHHEKNIKSHIKAIQTMSSTLKKLTKVVGEIKKGKYRTPPVKDMRMAPEVQLSLSMFHI